MGKIERKKYDLVVEQGGGVGGICGAAGKRHFCKPVWIYSIRSLSDPGLCFVFLSLLFSFFFFLALYREKIEQGRKGERELLSVFSTLPAR